MARLTRRKSRTDEPEEEQADPAGERAAGSSASKRRAPGAGKSLRDARARLAPIRRRAAELLRPFEDAFVAVLAILGAVLVGIWSLLVAAWKLAEPPARALARRFDAAVAAASRLLTPARGLLLAAVGCALLLALSQFVDYRGIAIGADAYEPGISSVAPAPEVEREELGSAHSYAMVPVAIVAVALLLFALRTRRWQVCRLVCVIGLAAIVVCFAIDRPAGLDEGQLNRDFTGVEAKILGGWWMQLFAGAGLALTSLLLGAEIRRESAPRRTASAGRRGDHGRRRLSRRATGPEGASA